MRIVCPSVRPFVNDTIRYCARKAKHVVHILSLLERLSILVFWKLNIVTEFRQNHLYIWYLQTGRILYVFHFYHSPTLGQLSFNATQ